MEKVPNRVPVKTIEQIQKFEIWNIEDLPDEERLAAQDAIQVYKKSTNKEFRAGACAVAFNGEKSVKHNHDNEPGKGQKGHAEMLALEGLYETANPSDRRLKIMALAASYPDQSLVHNDAAYEPETSVMRIGDLDVHGVCGRCLKRIADFTGNNLLDSSGEAWDPIILTVMGTGQVLRTTLSALYPIQYVPHQTDIKPWESDEQQDKRREVEKKQREEEKTKNQNFSEPTGK